MLRLNTYAGVFDGLCFSQHHSVCWLLADNLARRLQRCSDHGNGNRLARPSIVRLLELYNLCVSSTGHMICWQNDPTKAPNTCID